MNSFILKICEKFLKENDKCAFLIKIKDFIRLFIGFCCWNGHFFITEDLVYLYSCGNIL